jgi:hypothetical protein
MANVEILCWVGTVVYIMNDFVFRLLIPTDVLNSESALYWYAVCKFIHGMGADGDEYMEKVLPTAVDFCAYMQR